MKAPTLRDIPRISTSRNISTRPAFTIVCEYQIIDVTKCIGLVPPHLLDDLRREILKMDDGSCNFTHGNILPGLKISAGIKSLFQGAHHRQLQFRFMRLHTGNTHLANTMLSAETTTAGDCHCFHGLGNRGLTVLDILQLPAGGRADVDVQITIPEMAENIKPAIGKFFGNQGFDGADRFRNSRQRHRNIMFHRTTLGEFSIRNGLAYPDQIAPVHVRSAR